MKKALWVAAVSAVLLSLFFVGCGRDRDEMNTTEARRTTERQTVNTTERRGENTNGVVGDVVTDAGHIAEDVVTGAGNVVGDAVTGAGNIAKDVGEGIKNAADSAKDGRVTTTRR